MAPLRILASLAALGASASAFSLVADFSRYSGPHCTGTPFRQVLKSGGCLQLAANLSTRWTCYEGQAGYPDMTAYVSDDCTDTTPTRKNSADINPVCFDCDMTMRPLCGAVPGALMLKAQCKNRTLGDFPATCDSCKRSLVAPFNRCVKTGQLELPEVSFEAGSILVRGTKHAKAKLIGHYHRSADCSGPIVATPSFPADVCTTSIVARCHKPAAGLRLPEDPAGAARLREWHVARAAMTRSRR